MDIHNGKAVGSLTLAYTPTLPNHAARLQDIQSASAAAAAPIFITGVTPTSSGNVGSEQYVANTVPANIVVTDCVSDTANVRVAFLAESGASFYSIGVTYNSSPVTSISEHPTDKRTFVGYVDVVMSASGTITLVSSTGATASVNVVLSVGGPAVQSLNLGANPGAQTELKSGDTITISGVIDNTAVSAQVVNSGVAASGSIALGATDSGGAGFKTFTGTVTVANRTGTFGVTITGTNSIGTVGNQFTSSATKVLNQTFPTVPAPTFTYPGGQEAVKSGQTVTATSSITNADSVSYAFTQGTVAGPAVLATNKTLTCTNNVYQIGTNNYTITATKSSNGAVTVVNSSVACAGVAEQISINITGSPVRLRSDVAGADYVVNLTSNQTVHSTQVPTLVAPVGTWQGSWVLAGNTWSRTLRIIDGATAGTTAFTSLSLFNKALVETTVITAGASYTVGGFVLRTITFNAFAQHMPIGATVVTNSKVHAQYAGTGSDLTYRADTGNAQTSFTLTNSAGVFQSTGATDLFISDAAFAGSNTSGTLQLTIEELA